MIFETMVLSLIIGKVFGGRIRNIGELDIKRWYIFAISFIIEVIALLIVSKTDGQLSVAIEEKFFLIHIISYSLLIIGLIYNFGENGFKMILIGAMFNFIPIILNGGKMPVAINALNNSHLYTQLSLLEEGRILTHSLGNATTKFMILGDIIPIPKPYIFPKIISIGDIFISVGILVLILSHMKRKDKVTTVY